MQAELLLDAYLGSEQRNGIEFFEFMQPTICSWTDIRRCLTPKCWHPPLSLQYSTVHLNERKAYITLQVEQFNHSSVSEVVQNYFAIEGVPFDSYCEWCKNPLTRKDFFQLTSHPEGLVINLPRLSFDRLRQSLKKNETPVNLGEDINLGSATYKLVSSVEHIGSPDSGFNYYRVSQNKCFV